MFGLYAELFLSQILGILFVVNDKVQDLRTEAMWDFARERWWGYVEEMQELREEVKGRQRAPGFGAQPCGGASGTCVLGCRVLLGAEGSGRRLWSQNADQGRQFGKKS